MPRDSCKGCPALETKDGEGWCYYYQSWARPSGDEGCGNDFKEKPEFTQAELHIICYELTPKYEMIPNKDEYFETNKEWPSEFNADIQQAVEKAKEEMREKSMK